MSEFQEELPIKATSKTVLSYTVLHQTISFYYYDPTELYYSYVKNDLLGDLLDDVTSSMQEFLSNDRVEINDDVISLRIRHTELLFHHKKKDHPIVMFSIVNDSPFKLLNGINTILLDAEQETLDYPITSSWRFPGKVIEVKSPLHYEISGFNVLFTAKQSDVIGGIEKILFSTNQRKLR